MAVVGHRRDDDGGEKDSSKGTSYCCVNPETQTSNQTIELRNISASKYPELARRYLEEKATMYVKQLEEYRRVLQKRHFAICTESLYPMVPISMKSRIW